MSAIPAKRILRFTILTQYFVPEIGAPQTRLLSFAKQLQLRGHQVRVITAFPNYPQGRIFEGYRGRFLQRETVQGVPVTRSWVYPATGRNIAQRLANYLSFTVSSLLPLAAAPQADIIFVESPPLFLGLSAWLSSAIRRQKLCLNVSDLWPDSAVALGILRDGTFLHAARLFEQWLYERSWRVCGVTQGIVEALATEKGVDNSKIQFLPNGVDTDLFRPQSADQHLLDELGLGNKSIFVYTGTHGYAQGLDVIVQAALQLKNRPEIAFLLVGDGPEKTRLQTLTANLDLTNVHFIGTQPLASMPRILSLATASVVSLRDLALFNGARPSKIFPALACAKPVIYCGRGEAAALIEGAQCGLVTPPGNAAALASAIENLTDEPEQASEMGLRGLALVERDYRWEAIVDRWLAQLDL